jgi:hypothetical protein
VANPQIIVQYIADTAKLVESVQGIKKEGEGASKSLKKINVSSLAKWSGAAVAVGAGVKFLKGAADAAADLAKKSMALSRTTGMDTTTASEWVTVLKERGIATDTFQTSIVKLSKTMEKNRVAQQKLAEAQDNFNYTQKIFADDLKKGGDVAKDAKKEIMRAGRAVDSAATAAKNAHQPFENLNVRMQDIKKGNTQAVIKEVADGLSKLKNPAEQAAKASALFGRQGQKLAPLLYKGSKAIQEQLDTAKRYGAVVGDKTAKQVAEMAKNQREMNTAMEGVKVQVGTALMPVMLSFSKVLLSLTKALNPILKNTTLMKVALGLLVVAFAAYKTAVIISTIASLGLDASMLPLIVTVGAVVIAIAALIAIGVLLVQHWDGVTAAVSGSFDEVKKGAQTVVDWLTQNWPLLLAIVTGPFGLAVLEIQKHWDAITGAAKTAFDNVKGVFTGLGGALLGGLGKAAEVASWGVGIGKAIKSAVVGALAGVGAAVWGVISGIGTKILAGLDTVYGWGKSIGHALHTGAVSVLHGLGNVLEAILKGAINTVLSIWNDLKIPGVNMPGPIPDIPSINLPNIPLLKMAKGGLVTGPTRALLGEAGPELVVPLSGGAAPINVRVFIGDTELRGLVRAEVVDSNTRVARSLLAGAR